jgi:hypothetical protein
MILPRLIRTLVERGDVSTLRQHHDLMRIAGAHTLREEDSGYYGALRCALTFAEKYGKYPSFVDLKEYINGPTVGAVPTARDDWFDKVHELQADPDIGPAFTGSWPQILDEVTVTGRKGMFTNSLYIAKGILEGSPVDMPGIKITAETPESDRVTAMIKYLDEVRRKDFSLPSSAPDGAWREKADIGADALLDGLKDTIKDRAYTGFSRIDSAVAIGPKQSIKYIGILGFSNHGKSMIMRTMAYNMALGGKRILYIAREDTALNTWTQLSFLHSYTRPELDIPPINVWRNQPQRVTPQQQDNLRELIDDLKSGATVPGEIVVKTCPRWPEIVQELETGLDGKPYDVLMIDYLSHLDTGQSGSKIHDEIRVLFKKAQALAMDYKSGRGLVVVTPMQAGKKPMQEANAAEGEDWGVYNDLGAVDYYTDACRDMDLVISVWHTGDLKNQAMMKVSCLKSREDFFDTHFLAIDRRTRMVMDPTSMPVQEKISTYRDRAMYETSLEYDAAIGVEELSAYG